MSPGPAPAADVIALALTSASTNSTDIGGRFQVSGIGDTSSTSILPHDSKQHILTSTSIAVTSIMLIFFFMRLYSRAVVMKTMRLDDWFIIPSTMLTVLMTVFICLNAKAGGGNHVWDIKKDNLVWMVKTSYLVNVFYVLGMGFVKASMLFQLWFITARNSLNRRIILGIFALSICFSIANFFLALFPCYPVDYLWKQTVAQLNPTAPKPKGSCMDLLIVSYTTSGCNIVMDLLIWIAPMPLVRKLRVPKPQKIALYAIFSLGGGACAAAIARCVANVKFGGDEKANRDGSYEKAEIILWSVAEINIAIVCACLPLIRPLAKMVFPRWFKGQSSMNNGSSSGNNLSAAMKMGSMSRDQSTKRKVMPTSTEGYGSSEEALATPGIPVSERELARDKDLGGIQLRELREREQVMMRGHAI